MAYYLRLSFPIVNGCTITSFHGINVQPPAAIVVDGPITEEHVITHATIDYNLSPNMFNRMQSMKRASSVLTAYVDTKTSARDGVDDVIEFLMTVTDNQYREIYKLPTKFHPIVPDFMREVYARRKRPRDSIEIRTNCGYDNILEMHQGEWGRVTLTGTFFDGPTRTVAPKTHELRIRHIAPSCNPQSIANTIEQAQMAALVLEQLPHECEYGNNTVIRVLTYECWFCGRFPRLEDLCMPSRHAPRRIDARHCPRLMYFRGIVETERDLIEVLTKIPTLVKPPRCGFSVENAASVIEEHTPHLLYALHSNVAYWCPRLSALFRTENKLFTTLFVALDRLVEDGKVAYTDPAALEDIMRYFVKQVPNFYL